MVRHHRVADHRRYPQCVGTGSLERATDNNCDTEVNESLELLVSDNELLKVDPFYGGGCCSNAADLFDDTEVSSNFWWLFIKGSVR